MNEFHKKSIKERIALSLVINKIMDGKSFQYYETPIDGYDKYDGALMIFNEDTNEISGRCIIEAKIRDTHYPTLLLEKIKYDALIGKATELSSSKYTCKIMYLCTTPNGSYYFDLHKIEPIWIKEMHWASTTDKSKGKVLKDVFYLKLEDGKTINVKQKDVELIYNDKHEVKKEIKRNVEHQQTNELFKFLFTDKNNNQNEEN